MNRGKKNFPKIDDLKNEYDLFFTCMVPKIDDKFLNEDGKILFGGYGENDGSDGRKFKCLSAQIAEQGREQNIRSMYTSTFWHPFGYEFDIDDRDFKIKMASYTDMATLAHHNDVPKIVQPFFMKQGFEHNDYIKATVDGKKNVYIWNKSKAKEKKTDVRDVVIPKLISRFEKAAKISCTEKNEAEKQLYANHTELNTESLDNSFTKHEYGELTDIDEDFYTLPSMGFAIRKGCKNGCFVSRHNEFCAYPIKKKSRWIKPKRLVVDVARINFSLERGDLSKEDLEKFCQDYKNKYSHFYGNKIRMIDFEHKQTCLTTISNLQRYFNGL